MKQKAWKRLGAAMLTLAMLFSVVPSVGFAVDVPEQTAEEQQAGTYRIQVESEEGIAFAAIVHSDENKESIIEAAPGETVSLSFYDQGMTPGTAFVKWVDDIGNITDLRNPTSYFECSFTMPEGDVRIHAELAANSPTVSVENGGMMVPERAHFNVLNHASVYPNREVYLYYDDELTPDGKVFSEWYVKSGDVELKNPTSMEACTFVVPDGDVEIGVKYKDARSITVENGYAQYYLPNGEYVWNTANAIPGTKMTVAVNPYTKPQDLAFSHWVVRKGNVTLKLANSATACTFIMPDEDVEIAAEFVPGYAFTVVGGDTCRSVPGAENDEADWYVDRVLPGDTVWAIYDEDETPDGMEFARWVVTQGSMTLDRPEEEMCTFTMPEEDVVVTATYKPAGGKAEAGWGSDKAGKWYNDENGNYVTGWQEIDGNRYYFAPNGYMHTGWLQKDGNWYYLDPQMGLYYSRYDGSPSPEEIDGKIYSFDQNGVMQTGWVELGEEFQAFSGWFYHAPSGEAVTGWQVINGKTYYFRYEEGWPGPYMQIGWREIDGNRYYFHEDGHMAADEWIDGQYVDGSGALVEHPVQTGWQQNATGWWYNDEAGNYVTGWKVINGCWYYFSPNGYMQTGWQQINGYWYYFSPSGDMQTGWQQINGYWYYFSPSGDMQTGWQVINGYWYYFSPSGDMLTGWQVINGYWYYFSPSGDMQTGWQVINGYWYYFSPSGDMLTGWQWINGYCYYFYPSGYMAANTWIGGSYVDGSGAWVQ